MKKRDLTSRQQQAWKEYFEELGEDWDAIPSGTSVDKLLSREYFGHDITTYGGYKEIPKELVQQEAKKVGYTGKIPKVIIGERTSDPRVEVVAPGKYVISIPEGMSKPRAKSALRHELAHLYHKHLSSFSKASEAITSKQAMKRELQACIHTGDSWTDALIDNAVTMVLRDGVEWREVREALEELQPEMGIPPQSLRRAVKYVNNYLTRHGLEDE